MVRQTSDKSSNKIAYVGFRKVHTNGGSVVVSLPASAIKNEFDCDPEDLNGEDVSATLRDNGEYHISLGPVIDE